MQGFDSVFTSVALLPFTSHARAWADLSLMCITVCASSRAFLLPALSHRHHELQILSRSSRQLQLGAYVATDCFESLQLHNSGIAIDVASVVRSGI